jgi:hypothetical protein
MIDFSELALSPNESRAARNFLGLSQAQAAEQSNLPAHKLKRFETGNYVPDSQFVQELRDFFEGQGYNFHDEDAPGAKAKARGDVFPAGVIGETGSSTVGNQPRAQSANLQFMRIHPSLGNEQIDRILERIEDNERDTKDMAAAPVSTGFLSESPNAQSQAQAISALRKLAENGLLHAKLLGRDVITGAQKASPDTIGDLIQMATGDALRAVIDDDKEAQARLKSREEPTEVLQALIG